MVSCVTGWPSLGSVAEDNPEFLILLPSPTYWVLELWACTSKSGLYDARDQTEGFCVHKASTLPIERISSRKVILPLEKPSAMCSKLWSKIRMFLQKIQNCLEKINVSACWWSIPNTDLKILSYTASWTKILAKSQEVTWLSLGSVSLFL